jgi:hypothetical protein
LHHKPKANFLFKKIKRTKDKNLKKNRNKQRRKYLLKKYLFLIFNSQPPPIAARRNEGSNTRIFNE